MESNNILFVTAAYKRATQAAAAALLAGLLQNADIGCYEKRLHDWDVNDWQDVSYYMRTMVRSFRSDMDEEAAAAAYRAIRVVNQSLAMGGQCDLTLEDILRICGFPFWWNECPSYDQIVSFIQLRNELVHQAPMQSISVASAQVLWLFLQKSFLKLLKGLHNEKYREAASKALLEVSEVKRPQPSLSNDYNAAFQAITMLPSTMKDSIRCTRAKGDDSSLALQAVQQACASLLSLPGPTIEAACSKQLPAGTIAALLLLSLIQYSKAGSTPSGSTPSHSGAPAQMGAPQAGTSTFADLDLERQLALLAVLKAELPRSPSLAGLLMHKNAHLGLTGHPAANRCPGVDFARASKTVTGFGTLVVALEKAVARCRGSQQSIGCWAADIPGPGPSINSDEGEEGGSDQDAQGALPHTHTHMQSFSSADSTANEQVRAIVEVLDCLLRAHLGEGRASDRRTAAVPTELADCPAGTKPHKWIAEQLTQVALLAIDTGDSMLGRTAARALKALVRDDEAAQCIAMPEQDAQPACCLQALLAHLRAVVLRHREAIKVLRLACKGASKSGRGLDAADLSPAAGVNLLPAGGRAVLVHARNVLALARLVFSAVARALLPANFRTVRHGGAAILQGLQIEGEALIGLLTVGRDERWAKEQLEAEALGPAGIVYKGASGLRGALDAVDADALESMLLHEPVPGRGAAPGIPVRSAPWRTDSEGAQARRAGTFEAGTYREEDPFADDNVDQDAEGAEEGLVFLDSGGVLPMPSMKRRPGGKAKRGQARDRAARDGAGPDNQWEVPRVCDASSKPVQYTLTNDLVNALRLHIALWAPGRVKLTIILPASHTPAAPGATNATGRAAGVAVTGGNPTEELVRVLTASVVETLHEDVVQWLWDGTVTGALPQAGMGKGTPLAAVQAGAGSATSTAQTRQQTLEAYFSDRGGGSDDRYSIVMDLPIVAHSRPRVIPTAFKRLAPGQTQGRPGMVKDASMERQLPDVFEFSRALARIRSNLGNYDRARQEEGRRPVAGVTNTGKGGVARAARPAAMGNGAIDPAHSALAGACRAAAITLTYEDADASYRPSPAQ